MIGVCTCRNNLDDSAEGGCSTRSSSTLITRFGLVIIIFELALGLIVAVVNKKIYLLVRFIDLCQQLSALYYINAYYPNNSDGILALLDYFNMRRYSINLFKSFGSLSQTFTMDENDIIDLKSQNAPTKFRLQGIAALFIYNSAGMILFFAALAIVTRLMSVYNRCSKSRSAGVEFAA